MRRIAAAVLVDDAVDWTEQAGKRTSTRRKRTADEMKEIERLARAAIGVDTQRGDVLAVENLSFQETPLEIPPPPTRVEHWRRLLEQWSWVLRYAGLAALFAVVYFLILRPVTKQALATFRELPKKIAARNVPGMPGAVTVDSPEQPVSSIQRTTDLKKLLADKVKAEPAATSRLVGTWVREEEK